MNSSTKQPIRLGIIGCGVISVIHGEALQASKANVKFTACADQSLQAAQDFAARFDCPGTYTDMIEMVKVERLDGVVLCTWPAHHFEHVCALIDAGVRFILCEKALTLSGQQAFDMMRYAEKAGATVIEGFMLRYHPIFRQLESLVQQGEIGRIDTIRSGYQEWDAETEAPDDESRKWRLKKAAGGGVAFDGTCYPLHVCNNLARSLPTKVSFDGDRTRYDTLARLHGYIRYENDVTALIHSSLRAVVCKEAEVSGTEGSLYLPIAFGYNVPEWVAIRKRTGINNLSMRDEMLPPPDSGEMHENRLSPRLQLEHFADVIRGAAENRIPIIQSVVNMYTLEAIIESADSGRVTNISFPQAVRDAWYVQFPQ